MRTDPSGPTNPAPALNVAWLWPAARGAHVPVSQLNALNVPWVLGPGGSCGPLLETTRPPPPSGIAGAADSCVFTTRLSTRAAGVRCAWNVNVAEPPRRSSNARLPGPPLTEVILAAESTDTLGGSRTDVRVNGPGAIASWIGSISTLSEKLRCDPTLGSASSPMTLLVIATSIGATGVAC